MDATSPMCRMRSGGREIHIRAFPGPSGSTTASVGGGIEPAWAANGELFYRRPDGYAMMVVDVSTEPELTVGRPEELFRGNFTGSMAGSQSRYSVTPDGQRFLMSSAQVASGEAPARRKVIIIQNWVEELKQRVPVSSRRP